MSAVERILAAVEGVTSEDLKSIDAQIEEIHARSRKQVSALRAVRDVMKSQLGEETHDQRKHRKNREQKAAAREQKSPSPNGEPKSGGRPYSPEMMDVRKRALGFLDEEGESMGPAAMAASLNVEASKIPRICNHPWFAKDSEGWHLTAEGKKAQAAD